MVEARDHPVLPYIQKKVLLTQVAFYLAPRSNVVDSTYPGDKVHTVAVTELGTAIPLTTVVQFAVASEDDNDEIAVKK